MGFRRRVFAMTRSDIDASRGILARSWREGTLLRRPAPAATFGDIEAAGRRQRYDEARDERMARALPSSAHPMHVGYLRTSEEVFMYPYPTHSTGVRHGHDVPTGSTPNAPTPNEPLPKIPLKSRWPYWVGGAGALAFSVVMGFFLVEATRNVTDDYMGYISYANEEAPPPATPAETIEDEPHELRAVSEMDEALRGAD
jgi:hypothetical protein